MEESGCDGWVSTGFRFEDLPLQFPRKGYHTSATHESEVRLREDNLMGAVWGSALGSFFGRQSHHVWESLSPHHLPRPAHRRPHRPRRLSHLLSLSPISGLASCSFLAHAALCSTSCPPSIPPTPVVVWRCSTRQPPHRSHTRTLHSPTPMIPPSDRTGPTTTHLHARLATRSSHRFPRISPHALAHLLPTATRCGDICPVDGCARLSRSAEHAQPSTAPIKLLNRAARVRRKVRKSTISAWALEVLVDRIVGLLDKTTCARMRGAITRLLGR
ncbi:hypothetical protein FB45DRAFT_1112755 [Roridomyces roridus]|uniref:Uncharacterized protein n=1 Tax=Roridomyces roridus TaxID=1738132 RepID=A0AAD7FDX6_9AGAR|nr:hypothetical protein FB45DRAFT_1112755 [Roridomyces roridus]